MKVGQVKAGAVLAYFTLAINIAIGLVYTPWMIKSIGQSDYGLYTLAISVINLFIFDFGLGTSVQRFIAKYSAEGDLKKANEFTSIILRLYLALSAIAFIIFLVVYIYLPEIYKGLTVDELHKFKIIFVVASIFSVISFPLLPADGILNGTEKFIQVKICDFIHKVLLVVLMSACLLMGYGLYALVFISAGTALFTLILKLVCVRKYTTIRITWGYWDNILFKSVIGFTSWIFITAICQRFVVSLAPSILGIYHNADVIALFSIALSIEGYFFLFANALNGLFLPKVSKLIASENESGIMKLMNTVGIIQIYITGLIFLGLICFGKPFLHLWLGDGYESVYICFIIMILPSFISLPQNIANTTMVAKNKVRFQAMASIVKAIINIVLAFPLCKYYGALGMCLAITIAYAVNVVINNILYVKILGLNIKLFFKTTFLRFILPLVVLLAIGFGLKYIFANPNWGTFMLEIFIFSAIYLTLVPYLLGGKNKETIFSSFSNIIKARHG